MAQKLVSAEVISLAGDEPPDTVVVFFIGPKGGTRSINEMTPEQAQRLHCKLGLVLSELGMDAV